MALDDLLGGALGKLGGGGGGGAGALLSKVVPMLQGGGLGDLLGKFHQAGLKDKADSWVSTGANEPVNGEEVGRALGDGTVAQLSQETGMSHDEVKGGLAGILPGLVDRLTPGGTVPGNLDAGKIGGMLQGLDVGKLLGR
jgi:uncharacterized protein YidB (DUF937 family)